MASPRAANSEALPAWKRISDIVGGLVALTVATVPMALIAGAILVSSGGPILIRQRRIGLHGREFEMWKFRSLPVGTPQIAKSGLLRSGAPPITPLGRFLRRSSLDELPQLLNVLNGTMSLVGPRPALYTQTDLVALRLAAGALRARPGLTGLAQISGREDLTLDEKVAQDADYVRRLSPALDLRILLRTAPAVFRARGTF